MFFSRTEFLDGSALGKFYTLCPFGDVIKEVVALFIIGTRPVLSERESLFADWVIPDTWPLTKCCDLSFESLQRFPSSGARHFNFGCLQRLDEPLLSKNSVQRAGNLCDDIPGVPSPRGWVK